jgi:FPC/CPF motif-containing protein YcgG
MPLAGIDVSHCLPMPAAQQTTHSTHRLSHQANAQLDTSPPWTAAIRPWNPLHDDAQAASHSCYLAPQADELQRELQPWRACPADASAIHGRLTRKLMDADFACVAARSVLNRKTYRVGIYDALGTPEAALGLCHDLYEFSHAFATGLHPFSSFIAAFRGPTVHAEEHFEQLLWRQLQMMHAVDARYFDWDQNVSKDPDSPNFSFSIGGRAFYVLGLNPSASRIARRTASESYLVFNGHDQFEALRLNGKYSQLQKAIRARDIACQGTMNPMLDDFGTTSEARQYAGRAVPSAWRCPFQHQAHLEQTA